tara:strand:+ start:24896 stop:26392 length:1497 start_codon:yes stop_codon:yes gene_type:complete
MTLITDYPERVVGVVDGTEEFWINLPGSPDTDMKITQASIVAGVSTALNNYITTNNTAVTTLQGDRVLRAGDTMTGFLTLNADPSSALHSATKQYVDALIANKADATGASLDATASGITAVATNESTAIATTEYVAAKIKQEILKNTVINTAAHTLLENENGNVMVTRSTTGTCIITLPLISGLSDSERTEYYIIDAGNNAETYSITVNTNPSDTYLDTSQTLVLDTDNESVFLAIDSLGNWIVKDGIANASQTRAGITRQATTAEALSLVQATAFTTPSTLGSVLDQEIYTFNQLNASTKSFLESETGVWYISYTTTGGVAITLPDPGTLSNSQRFVLELWDAGNASTNSIIITPAGGSIDGASNFIISDTRAGCKIYTDGTDYFTVANTARATAVATSTSIFTLAGAGAIPLTADSTGTSRVDYTSVGTDSLTLGNATPGNRIKIVHVAGTGLGNLIPISLLGYSKVTFNDIGDSVELEYGTGGWAIISVFNATII